MPTRLPSDDDPAASRIRLPWFFTTRNKLAWLIMRGAKWLAIGIAPWLK
jgi:hypothetical protein